MFQTGLFFPLVVPLYFFYLAAPDGLRGPSSQSRIEPWPSEVKVCSPNHWTTREFPIVLFCFSLMGLFLNNLQASCSTQDGHKYNFSQRGILLDKCMWLWMLWPSFTYRLWEFTHRDILTPTTFFWISLFKVTDDVQFSLYSLPVSLHCSAPYQALDTPPWNTHIPGLPWYNSHSVLFIF